MIRPKKAGTPQPTWTSLVLAALVKADDFMSADMLRAVIPGLTNNRYTASIHHLRKRRAIDSVEGDGRLWWFATPHTDDRTFHQEQRIPEEQKRKRGTRKRPVHVIHAPCLITGEQCYEPACTVYGCQKAKAHSENKS